MPRVAIFILGHINAEILANSEIVGVKGVIDILLFKVGKIAVILGFNEVTDGLINA